MKYIISGGGFNNKGAESMLYTVISNIRNREPDSEITILCNENLEKLKTREFDNIKLLNADFRTRFKSIKKFIPFLERFKIHSKVRRLIREFKSNDVLIDVSGYILSSQWAWDDNRFFLSTLELAKRCGNKVIVLPQSFGPFDYHRKHRAQKLAQIKNVLEKCDIIFCREKDGYQCLKDLGLDNIELSCDLVLQNKAGYSGIYKKANNASKMNIKQPAALVIPSRHIAKRLDEQEFLKIYENSINYLLKRHFNVYISYYEAGDITACEKVKSLFQDNDKVQFLPQGFDCIGLSKVLPNFDLIITSRYHSAVHAYKGNIPCIIIGWAIKYIELAENVGQKQFVFDSNTDIDMNGYMDKLAFMVDNLDEEKKVIKKRVTEIQKVSCFDKMWDVIYVRK